MGTVRFLLATAVVLGHAGYIGFLPPYYAVQAFFMISGFYMAMVSGRYAGATLIFYLNRYSRLVVTYWIVASVTLIVVAIHPVDVLPIGAKLREGTIGLATVWLTFTNVFMFGQDAVAFFTIGGEPASNWLLVPQGWSLGAELWFYLLVPFLAPRSTRFLLMLALASIAARAVVIAWDRPFYPWQQRFFPAELFFFLAGMISYRCYVWLVDRGYLTKAIGVTALISTAAFSS
jgi:peptidoglycan/LPS O-acetylase OafA/YrhL